MGLSLSTFKITYFMSPASNHWCRRRPRPPIHHHSPGPNPKPNPLPRIVSSSVLLALPDCRYYLRYNDAKYLTIYHHVMSSPASPPNRKLAPGSWFPAPGA